MSEISVCKDLAGLSSIKQPGTGLAIWERSLAPILQNWIDKTDTNSLPDVRILVKPDELHLALDPLLDSCGLRPGNMRNQLIEDIHLLVVSFAAITSSSAVDVRLERISHDACWKFHRDCVETRLITAYRGPTTEWVRNGHGDQAIKEQKKFQGPLERLGDNDVAIFKGSAAHPTRGIVHRSPPISGTGLTRLLLCLNQQTDTSLDPWGKTQTSI